MSEPENFLSRWSRRKLEAEEGIEAPQLDAAAGPSAIVDASADTPKTSDDADVPQRPAQELAFDITKLPSLDSITAETDIRMFLQKGVPGELSRAALRRAWSADPAIRDFIEIAENQYDFATGKDLPGFGQLNLGSDELRRMVAEVFGGRAEEALKQPEEAEKSQETAVLPSSAKEPDSLVSPVSEAPLQDEPTISERVDQSEKDIVHRNKVTAAAQQSNTEVEDDFRPPYRPHGRALPQ